MYYRLFTDGHEVLGSPLIIAPALCLLPILILGVAWLMGADIRREESRPQANIPLRIGLHIVVTVLLSMIYIGLAGYVAIERGGGTEFSGFLALVVGDPPPAINQPRILMFAFGHWMLLFLMNLVIYQNLQSGGWLRDRLDQMRNPPIQRGELGSSHFCTNREYKRYRAPDSEGMTFFGAFWGERKQRLDAGQGMFCLNGEDAARGILTLGGPGSGKTQGVILPSIADNMANGHSLIVDPALK